MTGPEHYREGAARLAESEATSRQFQADSSDTLALQAIAHFLAALAAATAGHQHPESITWDKAIGRET